MDTLSIFKSILIKRRELIPCREYSITLSDRENAYFAGMRASLDQLIGLLNRSESLPDLLEDLSLRVSSEPQE